MRELKKILEEIAVDEGYLVDWYINSTDDSDPVWTEEHIEELVGDFILIPKSEVRKHMLKEISSKAYCQERSKESKAGNTDTFVNEIKKLQLKQVFEVVELADKYNLDRNDVFKQYTEATISVQKTVDFENPESLSKEEVRYDRE